MNVQRPIRRLAAVLVCLVCLGALAACSRAVPDAPEDFYVLDTANVLNKATENHIIRQNDALSAACGAQIVVVCVPGTEPLGIAEYTTRIMNEWGVGSAERNNGVVLVLAIEDDDYWIQQGKGLEDLLPSGTLKLLLEDHLEPYFAQKQYGEGVRALFDALTAELAAVYGVDLDDAAAQTPSSDGKKETKGSALTAVIWILVILIAALLIAAWLNSNHTLRRVRRSLPRRRTASPPRYTGRARSRTERHYGGYTNGYGVTSRRAPSRNVDLPLPQKRPDAYGAGRPSGSSVQSGRTGQSAPSGRSGGGGISRGGGAGRR